MTPSPTLHLWCSGLDEGGGIQHYTQFCLEALLDLYPKHHIRVFAKNDRVPLSNLSPRVTHHVFGGWSSKLRTLLYAVKGLAHACWEQPDFILTTHPHFMKALRFLGKRTPTIVSAHGIEVWGHLDGGLGAALRQATGLLPVSEFTSAVLQKEGSIAKSRIRVVPNTFREDLFLPGPKSSALLARYGLKSEQPVLLTVARLAASERYKGQDQILYALPKLLLDMPDLRYVIGGRGDDEARLRQIASELGVAHAVIFTGFIPEAELADHYRLADLYVMPSTGEGFGIVYLESLGCGRPCLAGNLDASSEALDGGRLGFVIDPRDPEAIADAILRFYRRDHDKPWLHEPDVLHEEAVSLFGKAAFEKSLAVALKELVNV